MRTLLAVSGGGHLIEMCALVPRLPFDAGEVTWFTFDTEQSRSLLAGADLRIAEDAPPRAALPTLRNAARAMALFRRERFDAVVSTGASMAVSALPVGVMFGADAYYIESAARVAGPSVSGRLVAAVPGVRTFAQHRSWAGSRWPYSGSVFDGYEPGPSRHDARVDRVVVTVGSQAGFPFDLLVERLVTLIPAAADVLWQTGSASCDRFAIAAAPTVPVSDLDAAMTTADVVVAHAGVGSALSALAAGRHPVLVPRRSARHEHVDDHQVEIAAELHARGIATMCEAEDLELSVLEHAASSSVVPRRHVPALAF